MSKRAQEMKSHFQLKCEFKKKKVTDHAQKHGYDEAMYGSREMEKGKGKPCHQYSQGILKNNCRNGQSGQEDNSDCHAFKAFKPPLSL